MTERFSFPDLFSKPIEIEKGKSVILDGIVIPKIQRPYAQGRTDGVSSFVRKSFLNEIFSHLVDGGIVDLNFIYGIIRPGEKGYVMELLDGQQRLTTLFLLYWYFANTELERDSEPDKEIRACLRKFSYETRSTSSYFCKKLADFHTDLKDRAPKAAITSAKWYFKSFDRDSTICAMLTMLDAIHEKYNEPGRYPLPSNLANIRFYVKSLGYYNLSEELYIKMNARGLQLSAFENFKADLTNFVSKCGGEFKELVPLYKPGASDEIPFNQNFSIKLDAKWVDLFWKKGAEDFDSSYMSFFMRFFAYKYILDTEKTITDRDMRQDAGIKDFYGEADDRILRNEYLGFGPFQKRLDAHPEHIFALDKVLDTLYEYDYKDGKMLITGEFIPVWERDGNEGLDSFIYNTNVRFVHTKLILLSAVFEFIDAYPVFDYAVYKEWMRVVANIIENTNIDSLTPVSSLVRKFSALVRFIVKENKDLSINTFYSTLSKWPCAGNENSAVVEEVEKARRIAEDAEWLPIFKEAEKHEYFKGMVLFFYDKNMTLEQYRNGLKLISGMFDKNGITKKYRTEHRLLRAIVSQFSSWRDMDQRYITERSEKNKYLKNTLASHEEVRKLFTQLALNGNEDTALDLLLKAIEDAKDVYLWSNPTENYLANFNAAINNLRWNVPLYDYFTSEDERQKACFRIYLFEGMFTLAVYGSTYSRIAIDSDRAKITKKICDTFKFSYGDRNQRLVIEKYGVCFGKEIWINKEINGVLFLIGFCPYHEVHLQLMFPSAEEAAIWVDRFEGCAPIKDYEEYLAIPSLVDRPGEELYEEIVSVIDNVTDVLLTRETSADE